MENRGKEVNPMESVVKRKNLFMEKVKKSQMELKAKIDGFAVMVLVFLANIGPAYAEETDMWTQGGTAAKDVYTQVVKISTPIAAASLVLLYLFRLFTHSEQNITKSRTVSKAIAWVVINGLGYFLVYEK